MLIYCCNHHQKARSFALPNLNRAWRYFVFLDECLNCGKAIAEIRELKKNGETICAHRWGSQKAINMLNQFVNQSLEIQNTLHNGTKSGLDWHYINGSTQVYNLNDTGVFKFKTKLKIYSID